MINIKVKSSRIRSDLTSSRIRSSKINVIANITKGNYVVVFDDYFAEDFVVEV